MKRLENSYYETKKGVKCKLIYSTDKNPYQELFDIFIAKCDTNQNYIMSRIIFTKETTGFFKKYIFNRDYKHTIKVYDDLLSEWLYTEEALIEMLFSKIGVEKLVLSQIPLAFKERVIKQIKSFTYTNTESTFTHKDLFIDQHDYTVVIDNPPAQILLKGCDSLEKAEEYLLGLFDERMED